MQGTQEEAEGVYNDVSSLVTSPNRVRVPARVPVRPTLAQLLRSVPDRFGAAERAALTWPINYAARHVDPFNVAEGAGEFDPADKARFSLLRMARRSGTECAAILHACRAVQLVGDGPVEAARNVLDRIVAILTAMVRKIREADVGADEGGGKM